MKNNLIYLILAVLLLPASAWSQSDQGMENRLRALTRAYFKTSQDVLTGASVVDAITNSGEAEALGRGNNRALDRKANAARQMKADGLTYTKGKVVDVEFLSMDATGDRANATAKVTFEFTIKAGPGAPDRTVYTDAYQLEFSKDGNKWFLADSEIIIPENLAGPAIPDSVPDNFLNTLPRTDGSTPVLQDGVNPNPSTRSNRANRSGRGNGNGDGGPNGIDDWRRTPAWNYQAAVNYATTWARGTNPSYRRYDNDCTNFISQCMKAGGWQEVGSTWNRQNNDVWFYGSWQSTTSYTWAGAHNFYLFANQSDRCINLSYFSDLLTGDVISIDLSGGGHVGHTVIVTAKSGSSTSQIYISYHTNDTLNRPLSEFRAIYPSGRYYAWGMY